MRINTNQIIKLSIKSLRAVFFIVLLYIFSNFIWWLIKPLGFNQVSGVAVHLVDSKSKADNVKNRSPFGMVVKENKVTKVKKVIDLSTVKVEGLYNANESSNSYAFLMIKGKSQMVGIDDEVEGYKITDIQSTGVVFGKEHKYIRIGIYGARDDVSSIYDKPDEMEKVGEVELNKNIETGLSTTDSDTNIQQNDNSYNDSQDDNQMNSDNSQDYGNQANDDNSQDDSNANQGNDDNYQSADDSIQDDQNQDENEDSSRMQALLQKRQELIKQFQENNR